MGFPENACVFRASGARREMRMNDVHKRRIKSQDFIRERSDCDKNGKKSGQKRDEIRGVFGV